MQNRTISAGFALLLLATVLVTLGCGSSPAGVVLWSDIPEQISNGDIVTVLSEGEDSIIIELSEGDEDTRLTMPAWRLETFTDTPSARDFADSYRHYEDTTAISKRNALPVRSAPNTSSDIRYRLRLDEKIKVLSQTDKPTQEGGLEDFWYEILTETGTRGYVFGFHLEIQDPSQKLESDREELLDEQLQRLLISDWNPASFQEMIEEERIQPDKMQSRYGLFFDTEERSIDIILHSDAYVFGYEDIQQKDSSTYEFTGAEVTAEFRGEDEVRVRFPIGDRRQSERFVLLEDDPAELVEQELERRQESLQRLTESGSVLQSSAYGQIQLSDDGSFMWIGFERLQPRILPAGISGSGEIGFDHFIADSLQSDYDGAMALEFDEISTPIIFLYEMVDDGLRLTHAPASTVEDQIVQEISLSPTIMFFQFRGSADDQPGSDQ